MKILSLKSKIVIIQIMILVVMGLTGIIVTIKYFNDIFIQELKKNKLSRAKLLSEQITEPLILKKYVKVMDAINAANNGDRSIYYIYITDKANNLFLHTFGDSFPAGLLNLKGSDSVKKFKTDAGIMYDLTIPILNGDVGYLHMGLKESYIEEVIKPAILKLTAALIIAGAVAIMVTFFFSRLITRNLTRLMNKVDLFSRGLRKPDIENYSGDEIGQLDASFDKMAAELERRINELEQEKQKISNILKGIRAGLVVVDRDFKIIWCNDIYTDWVEKNSMRNDYCFDKFGLKSKCPTCPVPDNFEDIDIIEHEFMLPIDGEKHFFKSIIAPLKTGDKVEHIIEVIQDISREKTLYNELIATSKMTALGELAAAISHEINNPLGAIAICTKGLINRAESETLRSIKEFRDFPEYLKTINYEIYRCKNIVLELRNFLKNVNYEKEELDINDLIREAIKIANFYALSSSKTIVFNSRHKEIRLKGNKDHLKQVMLNIIINGLDSSDRKGYVYIDAFRSNNSVGISVKDNGDGIPADRLGNIFKPFYTSKSNGTGLGLSICKRIIDDHNGKIDIKSTEGRGTTVTITLPEKT